MRIALTICLTLIVMLLPALEIDLEQAKKMALKNNHLLKKSEKELKSSKWSLIKAYSNLGPSVQASATKLKYDDKQQITTQSGLHKYDEFNTHGFTVSQPLFTGGSLFLNTRMQSNTYKISEASYKTTKLQTVSDVESKYFSALENKDLLEVARKSLESARKHEAIAKVRFESGTLTQSEYFKIKSETATKEVTLLQMESLWTVSRQDLENFLTLKEEITLSKIPPAGIEQEASEFDAYDSDRITKFVANSVDYSLKNNYSIKSSELGLKTAKLAKYMSTGKFLPTLSLSYNKKWDEIEGMDEDDSGTLTLNASMNIFPLIDTYSDYKSSAHSYSAAFFNHENTKDQISLNVKRQAYAMITAAKSIKSSRLALNYAEQTFLQMEERFRQNLISATELLDTEIMYISSQNQYTKSLYDFLKAKSALLNQLGVENELPIFK